MSKRQSTEPTASNPETTRDRGIRRHNASNGRGAPTMQKDSEGYFGFQATSHPSWGTDDALPGTLFHKDFYKGGDTQNAVRRSKLTGKWESC